METALDTRSEETQPPAQGDTDEIIAAIRDTVQSNLTNPPAGQGASGQKTVLEVLVADALKPILQEWLDRNLTLTVERILREELPKRPNLK